MELILTRARPIWVLAEEIFRREERPLHYRDLTQMILQERESRSLTPHESVRSVAGTDPRFKRVAEGVYALAEWQEYPVARFAKDIAYELLTSRGKPMPIAALGEEILEERRFVGGARQIVRNVLRSDNRFCNDSEHGLVGLKEWEERK